MLPSPPIANDSGPDTGCPSAPRIIPICPSPLPYGIIVSAFIVVGCTSSFTGFGKLPGTEATLSTGYCGCVSGESLKCECCGVLDWCSQRTRIKESTNRNTNNRGLIL